MSIFDRLKKKPEVQKPAAGEDEKVEKKSAESAAATKPGKAEKRRAGGVKAEKKAKADKKETKTSKIKTKIKGVANRAIVHPVISEKSAYLAADNKYVFAVGPKANKVMVKQAVAELYGVMPISVNIVNVKGKNVRFRRVTGRTKDWKKAIVTLKKGDRIDVYEGV